MNAPTKRRAALLALVIGLMIVLEWGRSTLHPWVRRRGIEDFGVSDHAGVVGTAAVVLFLVLALSSAERRLPLLRVLGAGVAALAYVAARPYFRPVTFDWRDVVAALLGFALAFAVAWCVWRGLPDAP